MKRKQNAGFSLAALIVFLTAASILMAAAVPAYQIQAKRELEEELIFRGEEYMRAIQKFQRKFGIYPPSVDALVETNTLRFVRRKYKDPITGEDFRLIGINPDGSITGSVVASQGGSNVPLFGDISKFGASGGSSTPPSGSSTVGPSGAVAGGGSSTPPSGSSTVGPSGAVAGGGSSTLPSGSGPVLMTGTNSQSGAAAGGGTGFGGASNRQFQGGAGGSTGQPTVTGVSGIIGVASNSKEPSLKIYNKREKYNEWEFVAILGQPGQTTQPPGTNPPPGGGTTPPPFSKKP